MFMALNEQQQHNALQNCHYDVVELQGDTAHRYSGVSHKLGEKLKIGAVSEHNIVMAYSHENRIHFATQFHPEHDYVINSNDNNINHHKVWLDNFIKLCIMHHDHLYLERAHPTFILQTILQRLEECNENPTCLAEEIHYL